MVASPSELSLDCKPYSYSMLMKTIGEQQSNYSHDQTQKLEEFLSRLEEEQLKIDAFKRELPLCMQLLANAMETSRQQLQTYRVNQEPRRVLEEFLPTKNSNTQGSENGSPDNKATWMTSAQLWSQASSSITTAGDDNNHSKTSPNSIIPPVSHNKTHSNFNTEPKNGGGVLPFSKERTSSCPGSPLQVINPDLALASCEKDVDQTATATTDTTAVARKARRCWSPDLHRRFVNALQMLGGSQVATPKQIRELMQVDGLTNDEVKSHLQKYRLHTRRPSPSPQSNGNGTPQLVVLGGIWVPSECAAGAQTLYGTHPDSGHANPHYYTQVPQEFYPTPLPPPKPPQQLLYHNHHMYNPSCQTTQSSPESNGQGGTNTTGGNRSEIIKDGKSESGSSWKADSGGETKARVVESNGREITLKF